MEEGEVRGRGRRTVNQMIVVGVLASALGIALGLIINWFPAARSVQADKIDTLYDVLIVATVPIFVLVVIVVIFSVIDFRMRPGEEQLDGPPIHGNTRLEIIWTALPALLILGLCTYAYIVLTDIDEAPAAGQRERVVNVTGQQFAWTFGYSEGGKRFTATRLYLPAGRPVKFNIRSRDVIHDFWVPDFRMKIDAVPGITTSYRLTLKPDALGAHDIVCAELCGLGHAYMRGTAVVLTPPKFAAWVRSMTSGAGRTGGAPAPGGKGGANAGAPIATAQAKQLFERGNQSTNAIACGACHTLADAGTSGTTGPDLDKVLKGKSAPFIKESIVKPDAQIAAGYQKGIMPSNFAQTLSPAQIDGLVKYLQEVAAR
jgi:cytochrome c oxidase subunit II